MFPQKNGFNNGMGYINNINWNPMMNMNNPNNFNCNQFSIPNNIIFNNNNQNYFQNQIFGQNLFNPNPNQINQNQFFNSYNNMQNMNNNINASFSQLMVTGGNKMNFISPSDNANLQLRGRPKLNYVCPNDGNQPILNIFFCFQDGSMSNIRTPRNMKVCDLLKFFINQLGISEKVLEKLIFFFFNGKKINPKEQKTVGQFFNYTSKVTVLDSQEVVGA